MYTRCYNVECASLQLLFLHCAVALVNGEEQCGNSVLGCNSDTLVNNALATRDDFHEDEYERETARMKRRRLMAGQEEEKDNDVVALVCFADPGLIISQEFNH